MNNPRPEQIVQFGNDNYKYMATDHFEELPPKILMTLFYGQNIKYFCGRYS